ncbi:hypothetical protein BDK51DRAFT_42331 [Blyttiomyces helicus]|uniref:Uncharacterized protein n=1 Tax=Blyttiomyces helicus TaxID=388810 RepID=A0A4P9WKY6_9FUNG|nr:hypothetical protein BDK51DRAFT_42331 [Blyttiomyces helicus]|eukprot:RKO93494.1 hypothetical protein BDK51DRAFT_42331 [Blyttiomyces helicus]
MNDVDTVRYLDSRGPAILRPEPHLPWEGWADMVACLIAIGAPLTYGFADVAAATGCPSVVKGIHETELEDAFTNRAVDNAATLDVVQFLSGQNMHHVCDRRRRLGWAANLTDSMLIKKPLKASFEAGASSSFAARAEQFKDIAVHANHFEGCTMTSEAPSKQSVPGKRVAPPPPLEPLTNDARCDVLMFGATRETTREVKYPDVNRPSTINNQFSNTFAGGHDMMVIIMRNLLLDHARHRLDHLKGIDEDPRVRKDRGVEI